MARRLPQLALAAFLGYWGMLFVLTHIPLNGANDLLSPSDKTLHLIAYAILAWMAAMALRLWHVRLPAILLVVLLGGAGYAAVDEWLQSYTDRTADLFDWVADVAGVCLGLTVFVLMHRWARKAHKHPQI